MSKAAGSEGGQLGLIFGSRLAQRAEMRYFYSMPRLPCPPELWPAFSALLDEALAIPDSERPQWLAGLGAEHAAVRPWVLKVLTGTSITDDADFMKLPVFDNGASSEFLPGQNVGPYVLKQRRGSGGMGEVWLASRGDGTLKREVALKLPHAHLMAGVLRRRFERERDILARLSHPNIAQLYDAGVAEAQYPYLAMEWVDGVSINEHCRDANLSIAERLDLFLQVLDAVGYAHGRLIAHRDLKPTNILVTHDKRVKLLDFGIAKLLADDTDPAATRLTRVGICMATPGYAAPEQLAGQPITVAVDLYALGVILHELLAGQRPFRDLRKTPAQGLDAPRASSRIEAGHGSHVGGLGDRQLRRALHGDLDAIIAKALEADPVRRYRSAEAFALDIQLSRQHRPISALRISHATVTLKFVRRHWVAVTLTLSLIVALIGGSAGIAWQAVRAERAAQRATAIKDFLIGVFRASDPRIASDKPRGEITARDLLDASSGEIETGFANQPETQIELLGVTADIYRELDETKRSNEMYAREADLAAKYPGADEPHLLDGLLGQADNADADGDDARSLALLAQADPLIRKAHLDESAIRARWLLMRGEALMNDATKANEAQAALEAAAALFGRVAPRDTRYPDALTDLGNLAIDRRQWASSALYHRQAIAVAESAAESTGSLLMANAGLALALKHLGDFEGAETAFRKGTDIATRTYGFSSRNYWLIASDWALFRYSRGDRTASLAQFQNLVQGLPDGKAGFRNATDSLEAAQVLSKYGRCLANDGQGVRSIQVIERARALLKKSAAHPADAAKLQLDLAQAYEVGGRIAEARSAFLVALQAYETLKAPEDIGTAEERWGRFLLSQSDLDGAEAAFNKALRLAAGEASEFAVYARAGLAAIAFARGDASTAQRASSDAILQLDRLQGFYDIRIKPYVWKIGARSLLLAGDYDSALAFAKRARDAARLYYDPASAAVLETESILRDVLNHASPRRGLPPM